MSENESLYLLVQAYGYLIDADPSNEMLQGLGIEESSEGKTLHLYETPYFMRKYDGLPNVDRNKQFADDMSQEAVQKALQRITAGVHQLKSIDPTHPLLEGIELSEVREGVNYINILPEKNDHMSKYKDKFFTDVIMEVMHDLEGIVSGGFL